LIRSQVAELSVVLEIPQASQDESAAQILGRGVVGKLLDTLVDLANRSGGSVQDNLNAGKLDSS